MTQTIESLLDCLTAGLADHSFAKLTLSRYRGTEAGLSKVTLRPVLIKDETRLSCLYHYATKDVTKHVSVLEGPATVQALLAAGFREAHLCRLTEDLRLRIDTAGRARLTRSRPTQHTVSLEHDRPKQRRLDARRPFLHALGVTDAGGRVIPAMSHKWKQIDKFLEIFAQAYASSALAARQQVRIIDFGAGKGYLTFALHDYLTHTLGINAQVTGIELREALVAFCNETAAHMACTGLSFAQGRLGETALSDMDILVALHACDTATDLALYQGIRAGAIMLLCAPCCHKEIRPQLQVPDVLRPVLRFGVHAGQEADMVTDSLRALLLEQAGYEVKVFEFISLEHTDKNKMILAVRKGGPVAATRIQEQIDALKAFYGIREQRLERLLKGQTIGM